MFFLNNLNEDLIDDLLTSFHTTMFFLNGYKKMSINNMNKAKSFHTTMFFLNKS
jgi:hypothetical protein